MHKRIGYLYYNLGSRARVYNKESLCNSSPSSCLYGRLHVPYTHTLCRINVSRSLNDSYSVNKWWWRYKFLRGEPFALCDLEILGHMLNVIHTMHLGHEIREVQHEECSSIVSCYAGAGCSDARISSIASRARLLGTRRVGRVASVAQGGTRTRPARGCREGKLQARGRELPRDPSLHNSTRTGRRTNNVIFIFIWFFYYFWVIIHIIGLVSWYYFKWRATCLFRSRIRCL